MVTFALASLVLVALVVWLFRLRRRDLADCAAVLGFHPVDGAAPVRGHTLEGFTATETVLLKGTHEGVPAELSERHVRPPFGARRRRGSPFTVLLLHHGSARTPAFRLQPVGLLRGLEALHQDGKPTVVTQDEAFDAAYHVYADDAQAAQRVLSADVRRQVLAFRERVAGALPASTAGYLSSGLLLGTFAIGPERSSYYVFGSPTKRIAGHVKEAAGLVRLLSRGDMPPTSP